MQKHRERCPHNLRHDLNGRPACRQIPQILQILIGQSNTTIGPIACFVIVDWLGGSIRFSVDKDIPAGGSMQRGGSLQVRWAWVGNVQRLEVVAVFPAKIDDVAAFGGAKVPLALFSTVRTEAERNAVIAQRIIIMA